MLRRRPEVRSWDQQHCLCTVVPGRQRNYTLCWSTTEHQCQRICSPNCCSKETNQVHSAPAWGINNNKKLHAPNWFKRMYVQTNLQVMLAIAESAVTWRSAAILLATRSGHEVPAASAVNAITYGFSPTQKGRFAISKEAVTSRWADENQTYARAGYNLWHSLSGL